jgi:hypothetical protein
MDVGHAEVSFLWNLASIALIMMILSLGSGSCMCVEHQALRAVQARGRRENNCLKVQCLKTMFRGLGARKRETQTHWKRAMEIGSVVIGGETCVRAKGKSLEKRAA